MKQNVTNIIFSITCILILAVPGATTFFVHNYSHDEARAFAQLPEFHISDVLSSGYFTGLDNYIRDHFGLRSYLIHGYGRLLYAFGVSANDSVVMGKDGWLFIRDYALDQITGRHYFSEGELTFIAGRLSAMQADAQARGSKFYFFIAPNKHSIYPEFLPTYVAIVDYTETDQLIDYLHQHTDIQVIDVRDALRNVKQEYTLYYHTDTHWNDYAGYIASQKFFSEILQKEIEPLSDFDIQTPETYSGGGDLARLMGVKGYMYDNHVGLNRKTAVNPDVTAGSPRLLIFADSFIEGMEQYINPHASYSGYERRQLFIPGRISDEKPDIVVLEMVERNLHRLLE